MPTIAYSIELEFTEASTNTPETFLPSINMSFGHLSFDSNPVQRVIASEAAKEAPKENKMHLLGCNIELRITDNHIPPRGEAHSLPLRPVPLNWLSAIITWPPTLKAPFAFTRFFASSCVEDKLLNQSIA